MVEEGPIMSTYKQEYQLAYVPVFIPQTSSEQTEQKRDKATQIDPAALCPKTALLRIKPWPFTISIKRQTKIPADEIPLHLGWL